MCLPSPGPIPQIWSQKRVGRLLFLLSNYLASPEHAQCKDFLLPPSCLGFRGACALLPRQCDLPYVSAVKLNVLAMALGGLPSYYPAVCHTLIHLPMVWTARLLVLGPQQMCLSWSGAMEAKSVWQELGCKKDVASARYADQGRISFYPKIFSWCLLLTELSHQSQYS